MAGHSKWANIKHRKGRQDAVRSKQFTRAAKEIIIAAKISGDVANNPRLRSAIAAAKAVNLPKDKIENAIKKGTGELAGGDIHEITYEGYGPGGVAILIEVASDNKNRIVAEMRHTLNKGNGNMGEAGSVAWMFDNKGQIIIKKDAITEEQVMDLGLEAGAEDIIEEDENWDIRCEPTDMEAVRTAFEEAGIAIESAEMAKIPQNTIELDADGAKKMLRLIDLLEENDDVQNVFTNMDVSDDVMAELNAE
ncbi:YebC/PmpR family DNA-binding transcriptional regulator [Halodesulfovibrio sp.]|jgi:YebC/PmpR family DNA-binding regulatory protein|uniref:YebC/PmpR family DNA-binding transcriptional regulator n=1 Tax=Halodesulfovibrio sp. TaxID=1912772 RepID=UPI0025FA4C24|nr:YebC/PmpR family DNA-binding transcriptional regulator [Halodesulfovibrio sp.]MCT4626907.1 YebC/PmpR family DNA-binding transcriptional regulator [Halodesulfovibrio sp.]